MAYVTPSHQFPLGVTMSLAQRLSLLEWANEANAWILEDDYDSEYRFSGRPLEALQGLDRTNRVMYLGTFSKVLFLALRLGYLVVPPDLTATFVAVREFVDRHIPILEQMALADFITEGHFTRHIRRMHTRYAERRAALIAAVASELGELLEVHAPEAGMHLVDWLPLTLTEDMKRIINEQRLGFVASVCPDGTPNLSPKGTTAVWDDEHLPLLFCRMPE